MSDALPGAPLLAAALEALGEGITLADASGRIIYSNPVADRILGVRSTDALPEAWSAHFGVFLPGSGDPFPTEAYPLVRALRGEETDEVEMLIRNPAVPEGVRIAVTGRPVRDASGTIVGAAVVFRDVTRLLRAEGTLRETIQELRELEAARADLLAFLVHDMKGPLSAVLAGTELAMEQEGVREPTRSALEEVLGAARALHGMVLDLLDVQAAEDGRLEPQVEPTPPAAILDPAVSWARARGARVEIGIGEVLGGAPVLKVDPSLLRRVVANLLDNCLRYGPPGGAIRVEVEPAAQGRVRIRVGDEGPGVPEELRDRIFDKYARLERIPGRRREGSVGLGLRFCRVAVEAHGGRIWVEDNDPVGAWFCLELPGV